MKTIAILLLCMIILWGCTYNKNSDESRINMEREYNKIQFCKDHWYNYHEITTKEVATQQWPWVSSTQLIQSIECDWFSPIDEPNKKIVLNSIFKYCKDIWEEQMGTMFDCRELYDDIYFQE